MNNKNKYLLILTILLFLAISLIMPSCRPVEAPTTSSPEPTPTPTPTPSQPDPVTEAVIKSDLIVLGNITDIKYDTVTIEPNGKVNYTTHTLSVENVIKGDPAITQLFIRTLGGEESASFFINDRMLVILNRGSDNFYTIYGINVTFHTKYGILWIESPSSRARSTVKLQDAIGQIIKIMLAQNIPVALPISEWPPLPTHFNP